MKKSLITEFNSHSERLKRALISKNYHAVRKLDMERRAIIQALCELALKDQDHEIFCLIEKTIQDTTNHITEINQNIKDLDMLTAKKSKMLQGYQVIS